MEGFSFYEKNAPAGTPDWVPTCTVRGSEGPIGYVLADGPASLVWLANLAALELHVPQWQLPETVDEVTLPEALATDPDPRPAARRCTTGWWSTSIRVRA